MSSALQEEKDFIGTAGIFIGTAGIQNAGSFTGFAAIQDTGANIDTAATFLGCPIPCRRGQLQRHRSLHVNLFRRGPSQLWPHNHRHHTQVTKTPRYHRWRGREAGGSAQPHRSLPGGVAGRPATPIFIFWPHRGTPSFYLQIVSPDVQQE